MAGTAGTVKGIRKQRTKRVDEGDMEIMLLEHTCRDDSVFTRLAPKTRESTWVVQGGLHAEPLRIQVVVVQHVTSSSDVGVVCNGKQVFPETGLVEKGKMTSDIIWEQPFVSKLMKGIGKENIYEARTNRHFDTFEPCVIHEHLPDGTLNCTIFKPKTSNPSEMESWPHNHFPLANIREIGTNKAVEMPRRVLKLRVPATDPMASTLDIDDTNMITHFARATPQATATEFEGVDRTRATFKVTKDRRVVTCNMGHAKLSHFLSQETRMIADSPAPTKTKQVWKVQIGPFAEHTISLEKKWKSNILTLSIDGGIMVEADREALKCERAWECEFNFLGEQFFDFEVFETNKDWHATDKTAIFTKKQRYTRECCISLTDENNLKTATLTIDGVEFRELPLKVDDMEEPMVETNPHALESIYGLVIQYKPDENAASDITWESAVHTVAAAPCDLWSWLTSFSILCGTTGIDTGIAEEDITVSQQRAFED